MRFAACLKKDVRLLTGGGARSLVFIALPVVLVLLMVWGMGSVAGADASISPFDIAVRDEDDTVMSRLLATQLDGVKLFRRVIRAGKETDSELLSGGCAAVVTIPKDFFYDLYDMRDTDVLLSLNSSMPDEAGVVRSAFTSLLGILEEDQRVYYAAARARYGELDDEIMQGVYHDYSEAAAEGALNRLSLFDISGLYKGGFDAKRLFFAASMLSMLIMFIPLCTLRGMSEELEAGLCERFAVSGGSIAEAVLSKLVVSLVMTALPAVLCIWAAGLKEAWAIMPVTAAGFLASFAFFMFLSLISRGAQTAQLVGNTLILLMLTVGGAILPAALLPARLSGISRFTLPGVMLSSLRYASLGFGARAMLRPVIILLVIAAVFTAASLPLLRTGRRRA